MKKILYTTDFSENAEKAFPYALRIAQKHNAELTVLHVFDIPTLLNYPHAQDALEMERQAVERLENQLKALFSKYVEDINVKYIAVENTSIVKGIISIIRADTPELVIVGAKGGSKIKEIIVGSTTKELIKQSSVPVLTIPEKVGDNDFKKVIYATDFQESDVSAIQQLIAFVKPFQPEEITVAHVSTPEEYIGDERMDWFKELVKEKISYDRVNFQLLLSNNVNEKINSYIKEHDIGLLVMLEKERKGIMDKLFHRDHVEIMEFHASVPLLSFSEHYLKENVDTEVQSKKEKQW